MDSDERHALCEILSKRDDDFDAVNGDVKRKVRTKNKGVQVKEKSIRKPVNDKMPKTRVPKKLDKKFKEDEEGWLQYVEPKRRRKDIEKRKKVTFNVIEAESLNNSQDHFDAD